MRVRGRSGVAAGVCVLWALVASGCNFVVGKYSVGGDDGGPSAEGGLPQEASDDGTMPVGDGGSETTPPMPESGPSCGAQPLPSTSTFADVVRACTVAVGCNPYFDISMSQCISLDYFQAWGSEACVSTISNCAGFTQCTGRSYPTTAQCSSSSQQAYCSGSLAINCGANKNVGSVVQDCAKYGGTCGTYSTTNGTVADCVVLPSCSNGDTNAHCQGNVQYYCENGVGYGISCASIDATCQIDQTQSPPQASCFFNAPSCSPAGYACQGSSMHWCTSNDQSVTYDCSASGLSCAPDVDDAGTAACLAPGCSPSDLKSCTESCAADGKTAEVCVGGTKYAIDCTTYGFVQCATFPSNGATYAYCQPKQQ